MQTVSGSYVAEMIRIRDDQDVGLFFCLDDYGVVNLHNTAGV